MKQGRQAQPRAASAAAPRRGPPPPLAAPPALGVRFQQQQGPPSQFPGRQPQPAPRFQAPLGFQPQARGRQQDFAAQAAELAAHMQAQQAQLQQDFAARAAAMRGLFEAPLLQAPPLFQPFQPGLFQPLHPQTAPQAGVGRAPRPIAAARHELEGLEPEDPAPQQASAPRRRPLAPKQEQAAPVSAPAQAGLPAAAVKKKKPCNGGAGEGGLPILKEEQEEQRPADSPVPAAALPQLPVARVARAPGAAGLPAEAGAEGIGALQAAVAGSRGG